MVPKLKIQNLLILPSLEAGCKKILQVSSEKILEKNH